jgi:hypothetical protein
MSGRRSHARLALSPAAEGVVRILRDVAIQHAGHGEFTVISREPGVLDERMDIEFADQPSPMAFQVEVADSRPLVMDGAVRHQLRLRVIEPPS